jgi:hypothetical protein
MYGVHYDLFSDHKAGISQNTTRHNHALNRQVTVNKPQIVANLYDRHEKIMAW